MRNCIDKLIRVVAFFLVVLTVSSCLNSSSKTPVYHTRVVLLSEGKSASSIGQTINSIQGRVEKIYHRDVKVSAGERDSIILEIAGDHHISSLSNFITSRGNFQINKIHPPEQVWPLIKPLPNADTLHNYLDTIFYKGSVTFGWVKGNDTTAISQILNAPAYLNQLPEGSKWAFGLPNELSLVPNQIPIYLLADVKLANVDAGSIKNASPALGVTGEHVIDITFNDEYKDKFWKLTRKNIGKQLAMSIDGVVISAPTVAGEVEGGRVSISGLSDDISVKRLYCAAIMYPLFDEVNVVSVDSIKTIMEPQEE